MTKNSFRLISFFVLVLVLTVATHAQPKDVLGWQDARWGMSESEITKGFGSKLHRLPARQAFAGLYVDYVIQDFLLDGNIYTVFFQMNNRTNKLDQILIRLNEMETRNPREEAFNNLDRLLTTQYGVPSKSDQKWSEPIVKYRSMYLTHTWKFRTSTVELYYGWDNQIYASLLSIRYFPTEYPRATATPNKSLDARLDSLLLNWLC